jgi:hypothetical protein
MTCVTPPRRLQCRQVPTLKLCNLLGHASAVMTLDEYADLFDDDLVAVADALEKAIGENCGTTAVSESSE